MPLAAGGMARIYIGRTTGIGAFERHVVLKLITPERANDQIAVQMFLDEARMAAALNHQNVAQVFEVGEEGGVHYLAMEYVHGQDMRALLAKAGSQGTRIPLELALTVVAGAAAGLNHAHERRGPDGTPLGIVHRDVSPSNIMIGYDGAVKLLDFGIAKATNRSVETQSGIIKGKFAYMAPEQCRGRDVDRRSDVFSLGIILYEVSTQHRCFRADSDFDTMHRIVTGDVVRPTRLVPNYPPALEAIVMKALAVDPNQRYQSAGQLLEAIESFAVASRMSLSTMGLGRFMRDMFGEVQEPWLTAARTSKEFPKESTISSTDNRTPEPGLSPPPPQQQRVQPALLAAVAKDRPADGIPDDEARFPDSAKNEAARTVLDLPRGNQADTTLVEDGEPQPGWNPRSYPAPVPKIASDHTLPPEGLPVRTTPHVLRRTPGTGVPHQPPPAQPPAPPAQAPQGSQPMPPVPQNQFNPSPSSSSSSASRPALPAQGPIPSTKHGYAGGMPTGAGVDLEYPRYQAPVEARLDSEVSNLKPNRRPLIIGGVLAAVGIVILLFVKLGGSKPEEPAAAPGSDTAGSDITMPATTGSETAAPPEKPAPTESGSDVGDEMISVHVESTPPGADVLVAGEKIGVTPLDKKLHRGTKTQPLTVHLDGYVDVTSKIDLSGDFSKKVTMKTPGEEPAGSGSAAATPPPGAGSAHHEAATPPHEHKNADHAVAPPPPHKPKCQPPGPNVDPINGPPVCRPGEKP